MVESASFIFISGVNCVVLLALRFGFVVPFTTLLTFVILIC